MEILSERVLNGEYYFLLCVLIGLSLLFFALLIFMVVDVIRGKEEISEYIFPGIVVSIISIVCGFGGYLAYKEGPDVEYKAAITDYNEVYKDGYKVVRHEGKIVTLKKPLRETSND